MNLPRISALALLAAAALCAQPKAPAGPVLERLTLHQFEDGPELPSTYEFLPGETVWFSCRIAGFHTESKGDDRLVKLTWRMSVLDPAGVLIDKPKAGTIEDRLLPQDKEWRPKFLATFQLPGFGVGGIYTIPVIIKDELAVRRPPERSSLR